MQRRLSFSIIVSERTLSPELFYMYKELVELGYSNLNETSMAPCILGAAERLRLSYAPSHGTMSDHQSPGRQ